MRRRILVLLSVVLLAGCMAPQRPYSFVVENDVDLVDRIVHGLATHGHEADAVDGQAGVVHTIWETLGTHYDEVNGTEEAWVRRYTITARATPSGTVVNVRADFRVCEQYGFTIVGNSLQGSCQTVDRVLPMYQRQLESLGQQLQSTIATGMIIQQPDA